MEHEHSFDATERTEYYLEQLFWPFVVGIAALLVEPFTQNSNWVIPTVYVAVGMIIAGKTVNKHFSWQAASTVGFIIGLFLALISGIELLVLQFSVAGLFGLLPKLFVAGFGTALIGGLSTEVLYISRKIQRSIQNKKKS